MALPAGHSHTHSEIHDGGMVHVGGSLAVEHNALLCHKVLNADGVQDTHEEQRDELCADLKWQGRAWQQRPRPEAQDTGNGNAWKCRPASCRTCDSGKKGAKRAPPSLKGGYQR